MSKQSSPRRIESAKQHQGHTDYVTILFEPEDHVATITMNRPDKHNACNLKMFQEIDHALSLVEVDQNIRVVVITGAGDRAFSAGVDFGE